ncbi:MAG: hypothetical protein GPOALKHO_000689 [Sodalis sp.]|uniref:hypothetical protein n=1 Tax=Sodalis sp. (in: enterobacteria) TaxID=1898979 RepID=UPI003873AFF8|nr:MAG: hypothetical protein GPOALKHO_000689 [Sodalis sp.]
MAISVNGVVALHKKGADFIGIIILKKSARRLRQRFQPGLGKNDHNTTGRETVVEQPPNIICLTRAGAIATK